MEQLEEKLVPLGRICGVFGLQGWLKIFSDTEPREGITRYQQWILTDGKRQRRVMLEEGKRRGKGVIAKLKGIDDRNAAELLIGQVIAVNRVDLPVLENGEYYWSDLIGLNVVNMQGSSLGKIESLFATGANDVMVVRGERERLIPWDRGQVIKKIDLEKRQMDVDWDPDF